MSIKTTSAFNPPCPENLAYLPFQRAGIEYMVTSQYRRILLGDPMGVGKTIQAIGFINAKCFRSGLVIVPASLLLNWEAELKKWLVNKRHKIQVIRKGKDNIDPQATIVIASYNMASNADMLRKLKNFKDEIDFLICDESHNIKNYKAKRTKAILGDGGLMSSCLYTVFISGTQMLNRPIELYAILNYAMPVAIGWRNWLSYAQDFCGAYHDGFGWNVNGASNKKELGQRLRAYFMVRRDKEKVLPQLPKKRKTLVFLDPTPKAKTVMKKMAKFDASELEGKVSVGFDGLSEARSELGTLKAPIAAKYLKDRLDGGEEKIVVFAHHKEVIKILEEELKSYGIAKITGDTNKDARFAQVQKFQNEPSCRVFIGSITAAGVGITLTAANYMAFVEASWVPGENDQAFDRIHRIGQESDCYGEFLVFPGSLDERILKTHLEKSKVIKEVMG